jgi:hypothetical protein
MTLGKACEFLREKKLMTPPDVCGNDPGTWIWEEMTTLCRDHMENLNKSLISTF